MLQKLAEDREKLRDQLHAASLVETAVLTAAKDAAELAAAKAAQGRVRETLIGQMDERKIRNELETVRDYGAPPLLPSSPSPFCCCPPFPPRSTSPLSACPLSTLAPSPLVQEEEELRGALLVRQAIAVARAEEQRKRAAAERARLFREELDAANAHATARKAALRQEEAAHDAQLLQQAEAARRAEA